MLPSTSAYTKFDPGPVQREMAVVNCSQFCARSMSSTEYCRKPGSAAGHQNIRLDAAAAFHGDDFMLLARLLHLTVKEVSSRRVHLLDVQILNVKPQIGNT